MNVSFVVSAFRESQYPPGHLPEIAFAGKSNVGKSSLINALTRRKGLARTSARPGRTQSINFFLVEEKLHLVDLPGYGFALVPLKVKESWRTMVETYLETRKNLKAVVVILDIRRGMTPGDGELIRYLRLRGIPALPVLTKADKLSRQQGLNQAGAVERELAEVLSEPPILFSARTGTGRDPLWARIRSAAGVDP
jgi:GTP-binding protein